MPSDPAGGACGCVLLGLLLIVVGLYLVLLEVLDWLIQSGLIYLLAAAAAVWLVLAVWNAVRHWQQERRINRVAAEQETESHGPPMQPPVTDDALREGYPALRPSDGTRAGQPPSESC
jgi:hypothetical protein